MTTPFLPSVAESMARSKSVHEMETNSHQWQRHSDGRGAVGIK